MESRRPTSKIAYLFFNLAIPLSVLLVWWVVFTKVFSAPLPENFYYLSRPIPWVLFWLGSLFGKGREFLLLAIFCSLLVLSLTFYYWAWQLLKYKFDAWAAAGLFPFLWIYWTRKGLWLGSCLSGAEILLGFLPFILACGKLIRFMQGGTWRHFFSVILFSSITLLTTGIGSCFLFLTMFVLTISEVFLGEGKVKLGRLFLIFVCSLGVVGFWYSPVFYKSWLVGAWEHGLSRAWWDILPIALVTAPILGTLSFLICDRRPLRQGRFFSFSLWLIFSFANWFWYKFNHSLFLHSQRTYLFLGLSNCLVLASLLGALFNQILRWEGRFLSWIPFRFKGLNLLSCLFLFALAVTWVILITSFWRSSPSSYGLGDNVFTSPAVMWVGNFSWWGSLLGMFLSAITFLFIYFIKRRYEDKNSPFWYKLLAPFEAQNANS